VARRLKIGVAVGIGIAVIVSVVVIGVGIAFRAPGIPHQTQGRENCISCHGQNTANPYPGWHLDEKFGNARCNDCHHPTG
jgi:nitrate/TMAO reductase-like tetraheme cytochrome c subunit